MTMRTAQNGVKVVEEIRADGGDAHYVVGDASVQAQVLNMVNQTERYYGQLDILINNAAHLAPGAVHEVSDEDLELALSTNLKACFWLTRAALPLLKGRGGGTKGGGGRGGEGDEGGEGKREGGGEGGGGGRGGGGERERGGRGGGSRGRQRAADGSSSPDPRNAHGRIGLAAYTSTKVAINGFIRGAALDYAKYNITVNGRPRLDRDRRLGTICRWTRCRSCARPCRPGRLRHPEDIAKGMLFLASETTTMGTSPDKAWTI